MKGMTWFFPLMMGLICLGMLACDESESSESVCTPGETQSCLCSGNEEGVQVCAEDGKSWGACEGCTQADDDDDDDDNDTTDDDDDDDDNDTTDDDDDVVSDGDAGDDDDDDSDGDETDGDVTDGDEDGDVTDGDVTDGDEEIAEEEQEAEAEEEEEVELTGFCGATGQVCSASNPCATETAQVEGFCITFNRTGYQTYYSCLYPPLFGMESTYTCVDITQHQCESNHDCPYSIGCGSMGQGWCGLDSPAFQGACESRVTLGGGSTPCLNDSQCTQIVQNPCIVCGNRELERPQEECEDGNQRDGDGCSSTCQMEGHCYTGPTALSAECATAEDCELVFQCYGGTCTCQY